MTTDSFGKPAPPLYGLMAGIPRRDNVIVMPKRKTARLKADKKVAERERDSLREKRNNLNSLAQKLQRRAVMAELALSQALNAGKETK